MSGTQIDRLISYIKIASVLISALFVVFNMGRYYDKLEQKLQKYDTTIANLESRVKDQEQWRRQVTSYYYPKIVTKN